MDYTDEELFEKRSQESKKIATHFRVSKSDNGKNDVYSYYKFSEPQKMNDGSMSKSRPMYLTCWGTYSCHLSVKDEDILPLLQTYNYEKDGDYPIYNKD